MPEACKACEKHIPKDRREDYGDVCAPFCAELRVWLDFYGGYGAPPCGKGDER